MEHGCVSSRRTICANGIDAKRQQRRRTRAEVRRQQAEAQRQVEMRERLIESARDYAIEVDAIALVVGGTPQTLLH